MTRLHIKSFRYLFYYPIKIKERTTATNMDALFLQRTVPHSVRKKTAPIITLSQNKEKRMPSFESPIKANKT